MWNVNLIQVALFEVSDFAKVAIWDCQYIDKSKSFELQNFTQNFIICSLYMKSTRFWVINLCLAVFDADLPKVIKMYLCLYYVPYRMEKGPCILHTRLVHSVEIYVKTIYMISESLKDVIFYCFSGSEFWYWQFFFHFWKLKFS